MSNVFSSTIFDKVLVLPNPPYSEGLMVYLDSDDGNQGLYISSGPTGSWVKAGGGSGAGGAVTIDDIQNAGDTGKSLLEADDVQQALSTLGIKSAAQYDTAEVLDVFGSPVGLILGGN